MSAPTITEHEALLSEEGPCVVVVAGPGRGKTACVLRLAAHSSADGQLLPGQRVLALTFARQAVFQIHDEARHQFPDRNLPPGLEIQTYDAFCLWVVNCFGRYAGLPRRVLPLSQLLLGVHEASPALLAKAFDDDDAAHLSFRQIAEMAVQLLRNSARLRGLVSARYPLVVVDEFQDTDDTRAELIQLLGLGSKLRLFADPEQYIYGFSGVPPDRVGWAEEVLGARVVTWKFPSLRTANEELVRLLDMLRRPDLTEACLRSEFPRLVSSFSGPNDLGFCAKHLLRMFGRGAGKTVGILAWQHAIVAQVVAGLSRPTRAANWTIRAKGVGAEHLGWAHVFLDWADWQRDHSEPALRRALAALLAKRVWSLDPTACALVRGLLSRSTIVGGDLDDFLAVLGPSNLGTELSALVAPAPGARSLTEEVERLAGLISGIAAPEYCRHVGDALTWLRQACASKPLDNTSAPVRAFLQREELAAAAEQKRLAMRGIFAMTIHAAKGRQFDHTVIVLQRGAVGSLAWRENRSGCRNIVYVAASRSRQSTHFLLQTSRTIAD